VLHLAEQYLRSGDLWRFLADVSDEIGRLHRELQLDHVREDEQVPLTD
jgi:hypothetical protein